MHIQVDYVRAGVGVVAPDVHEDVFTHQGLSGMPHQVLEQPKLSRSEVNGLVVPRRLAALQVNLELADP